MVQKAYLFKELYIETHSKVRNPDKGRFFRVQVGLRALGPRA